MTGFLSRERSVAPPGYNRWLVPPAALAIHLSIGQAYAYSVFNLPLTHEGGWSLAQVGWIFSLEIVVLGLSAALFGRWLESVIWKESSKGLTKPIHRVDSACDAQLDRICKVAIVGR